MLGKMGEMKKKTEEVKKKLTEIAITEKSEDELIEVTLTADKEIKDIAINESLLNQQTKSELENKLVEVINSAIVKAESKGKEIMKESLKDTFPNVPGLDLDNWAT